MASAVEIPAEHEDAGDGYAIVHVAEGRAFDADEVWAAQARRDPSDSVALATFTVTSRAGTVDDPDTGGDLDETGNTIVVASLTGTQTRALRGLSYCDLQVTPDGSDPITFIKWQLVVDQDVTR